MAAQSSIRQAFAGPDQGQTDPRDVILRGPSRFKPRSGLARLPSRLPAEPLDERPLSEEPPILRMPRRMSSARSCALPSGLLDQPPFFSKAQLACLKFLSIIQLKTSPESPAYPTR